MLYPAPGVDSLWVRGGSHAGKGALIGGAVTGIGLGLLAYAATASAPPSDTCGTSGCDPGGFFIVGFFVGGAGGALVGALIGAAIPRWHLRVP